MICSGAKSVTEGSLLRSEIGCNKLVSAPRSTDDKRPSHRCDLLYKERGRDQGGITIQFAPTPWQGGKANEAALPFGTGLHLEVWIHLWLTQTIF